MAVLLAHSPYLSSAVSLARRGCCNDQHRYRRAAARHDLTWQRQSPSSRIGYPTSPLSRLPAWPFGIPSAWPLVDYRRQAFSATWLGRGLALALPAGGMPQVGLVAQPIQKPLLDAVVCPIW